MSLTNPHTDGRESPLDCQSVGASLYMTAAPLTPVSPIPPAIPKILSALLGPAAIVMDNDDALA
jgi:hypothetical protein